MPAAIREIRTFVGEPASHPGSGYAGFIVGLTYQLLLEYLPDGTVAITPQETLHVGRVVVSQKLFERWWVKQQRAPRWGSDAR